MPMKSPHKLFLYSMNISPLQCERLTKLVNKKPTDIQIAVIENATDVIQGDTSWQEAFRDERVRFREEICSSMNSVVIDPDHCAFCGVRDPFVSEVDRGVTITNC